MYNWNIIFCYFMMNIFQFLVIALTVCLAPTSETMFRFNAVVSGLLILNESR